MQNLLNLSNLNYLLVLLPLTPLLCALVASNRVGQYLLAIAALPALITALLLPTPIHLALPWLLLGAEWGLDALGQAFLLITAGIWLLVGIYSAQGLANPQAAWRFRVYYCLSLSGNFLLIIAQDMLSFFLGFSMMGLAAYGLIAHQASVTTRRAGRIYMIWTILGELCLFAGIVLTASAISSLYFVDLAGKNLPIAALICLNLGFGIKLALPGLHTWLPIAHGAAPPAISALLSGVMVKAGILGLLRFLPAGEMHTIWLGQGLIYLGWIAAFYAVIFGLLQTAPKVILAYSTMSQLGILTVITGFALSSTNNDSIILALLLYIVHHAGVKAALFLGVGLFKQTLSLRLTLMLGLLALVLAGLPFSSGALAKTTVKTVLSPLSPEIFWYLMSSTLATTLLMGRFLWSLWQYRLKHHALHAPARPYPLQYIAWIILVLWVLAWPWVYAQAAFNYLDLIPILLGLIISAFALRPRMPIGDLPILFAQVIHHGSLYLRKTLAPSIKQVQKRNIHYSAKPP